MRRDGARESREGFTLVELLIAGAIALGVASVVLGLSTAVLRDWRRIQGIALAEAAGRRALDALELDLQAAIPGSARGVAFAATIPSDTGISGAWMGSGKPEAGSLRLEPPLASMRFGCAGMWLRFVTFRRGKDRRTGSPAMPAAVAYQLIRRSLVSGQPPCYGLYRAEVDGPSTFAAGFDLEAAPYRTGEDDDGGAGNLTAPPPRRLIAPHVVDFGVQLFWVKADAEGRPRLQSVFPEPGGDPEFTAGGASSLPAYVDAMVRVLTDEGVVRIAAIEEGRLAADWWETVEAGSVVCTRRVAVLAKTAAAP